MLDLMIVMTLTMVVISMTSVWVYKTMLYSNDVNQRDSHARNISRISRQLRTDARQANSIIVNDDLLTIGIPNQNNIEYSIDTNSVHRKQATENETHQDRFEFASNTKLEWKPQDSSNSVALNIKRDFSHLSTSKDAVSKRLDAQIRVRANAEKVQ
jgi:hypothetical protein